MDRAIRKKIEYAFYHYEDFMKSAVISTVEFAEQGTTADYSKLGVQSSKSNGREKRLCALIDSAQDKLRWCYVVEKVLDYYKWDCKEKMIREKYFNKKHILTVCQEIGISERTFKYWKEEIILKAYQWAVELKAVRYE